MLKIPAAAKPRRTLCLKLFCYFSDIRLPCHALAEISKHEVISHSETWRRDQSTQFHEL